MLLLKLFSFFTWINDSFFFSNKVEQDIIGISNIYFKRNIFSE
jgi:hypothetical protein